MGQKGRTIIRHQSLKIRQLSCWSLSASLLLSGCLYYGQNQLSSPSFSTVPTDESLQIPIREYFVHRELSEDPVVIETDRDEDYIVQKLRFPSFTAYFYDPAESKPSPGIIVLPISNGNYHAEQMARYLASNGYACLRFKTRKEILRVSDTEDPLHEFETRLRAYILDIFQGIDWLSGHPAVDDSQIGLVGLSLGAITGSIVSGIDSRIKASVFILGGGDLAGILASSNERSVKKVRISIEKKGGLTRRQVEEKLNQELHLFDPIRYASRKDPSKILMINALLDRVIKRKHTLSLWEAWGKPPMIQLPVGHYLAILFLPYAKHKTLQHFDRLLGD